MKRLGLVVFYGLCSTLLSVAAGNLLPEMNPENYRSWGSVEKIVFGNDSVTLTASQAKVFAIEPRKSIPLEPGALYRLSYRAQSNDKTVRCMVYYNDLNGEKKLWSHNFLSGKATPAGTEFVKQWYCPGNATGFICTFYADTIGDVTFSGVTLEKMAAVAPGVNLFFPIIAANYNFWGADTQVSYENRQIIYRNQGGKSAMVFPRETFGVVPGKTYELSFKVSGNGFLRVMFTGFDNEMKSSVLDYNFLNGKLTGDTVEFRKQWVCPANVFQLQVGFYECEVGDFKLSDPEFKMTEDKKAESATKDDLW